ncbi:MAG: hypothetical protein JXB85_06835 [Anaerolineales bacterium]|nr:hypothetical protein [Anaerolineales bacterium]
MKLTPPTKLVFWITVALAVIGLVAFFVTIPFLSAIAFWLVLAAYVLLVLALLLKGL